MKHDFNWQRFPAMNQAVMAMIAFFRNRIPYLNQFEKELAEKTGTQLIDWIDHIVLPEGHELAVLSEDSGYEIETQITDGSKSDAVVYVARAHNLPRIVCVKNPHAEIGIGLQVECVQKFLHTHRLYAPVDGSPLSRYRRAAVSNHKGACLWVCERRGKWQWSPDDAGPLEREKLIQGLELWRSRRRTPWGSAQTEIHGVLDLAANIVHHLGSDLAAWVVMFCEREYWLQRNMTGMMQKLRQDRMGMGMVNYDHHTFRSSRMTFPVLIQIFQTLGFIQRERFYAGEEAGWGAQVVEHPDAGFALFLDVDLGPDEISAEFVEGSLPDRNELGTVGLWCRLHGDSIFEAGLHHVAINCRFQQTIADLNHQNLEIMPPFSEFSYLKQSFSKGDIWPVAEEKICSLEDIRLINPKQAEQFRENGAVGSHLELIERSDGFKGFNQTTVSSIIRDTDPRKYQ